MSYTQRDYAMDYLRAISCFMIVMLHFSGIYRDAGGVDEDIATLVWAMSRSAVPSFVLLSGAFCIRHNNIEGSFYGKHIRRVLYPTLLLIFLHTVLNYFILIKHHELEENYLFPLYQMMVGRADDTLWYMYVTIGLYTLVPSLVHFKYELSKEYFFPISIGLFIYFWIVSFNCRFSLIILFVPYMGYFILGSSMYDYIHMKLRNELSNIIGVGLIISSYIVLLYVYTKCMGDFLV